MGEHTSANGLAIRVLSLTMAMLTFLMFMYYNCDITAEMTSGPPGIPVKNFEDVLHHGYRFIFRPLMTLPLHMYIPCRVNTYSPYYQSQLAGEKPGTPKHTVYEKYLKAWLPDGYSQIFRMYVSGPSGFWTLAPLRCAAKFDPFLFLDCAPTPSILAQSKERKGSNFAIWQPWSLTQQTKKERDRRGREMGHNST